MSKLVWSLWLICVCATDTAFANSSQIRIDGSSTVYPITEIAIREFKATNQSVKMIHGISGTGGGFKKFCRRDIDIVNASRPISSNEIKICNDNGVEFIELFVAYDALTIVINPKNTWASTLSTKELKAMWEPAAQGKIKSWQQVNPRFPDMPLKLYGSNSDSGTFEYFTASIIGKVGSSRGDYSPADEAEETVSGVASSINAIGYLGLAHFEENKQRLKSVSIVWNNKDPAYPSAKSVLDGSYQPLSRPLFIYVNAMALNRPTVREFLLHYMNHGAKLVKSAKYVELPAGAYQIGLDRINKRITGSAFAGQNPVGFTYQSVLSKQPKP